MNSLFLHSLRPWHGVSSFAVWIFACLLSLLGTEIACGDDAATVGLFKEICAKCHSDSKVKGGVNLELALKNPVDAKRRALWNTAHQQIRNSDMPPLEEPQPTAAQREQLLRWLESAITRIDAATPASPGRPVMRRLTRVEYIHTMQDLLGVTFDFQFDPTTDFPADNPDAGFDNNGGVLTITQAHLDRYLVAAEQILGKVIVTDGLDGPRRQQFDAKDLRPGGQAKKQDQDLVLTGAGQAAIELHFEQEGTYEIIAKVSAPDDNKKKAQMALLVGTKQERFTLVRSGKDSTINRKVKLAAGRQTIGVAYLYEQDDATSKPTQNPMQGHILVESLDVNGPIGITADSLPFGHKRIFITRPGGDISRSQAAAKVLKHYLPLAFRRPVSDEEIAGYTQLFAKVDAADISFEKAMMPVLLASLVSPQFLFRIEPERSSDQDGSYALTPHELASRLSYFLWSSMPDEELFTSAASGKLIEAKELERQTRRMLADEKSQRFVRNFVTQWLSVRNIESFQPDLRIGKLGSGLRQGMLNEPVFLFQSLIADNSPTATLLSADYTFVNKDLAQHYKLDLPKELFANQKESQLMKRVAIAPGSGRGGILTMGAVLTATSHPTRTSPVKRGKWVLDNILGTPPPPPLPNVASLPEAKESGQKLTLRQSLELHRASPECASCHRRMDPIGFAFEGFDPLGRVRTTDESRLKVDTHATLPDGTAITGVDDLRKYLLDRREQFVRCLAEKLLTYGLGRGVEASDHRYLEAIVKNIEPGGYRINDLIVELIKSDAFRRRSALNASK